MAVVDGIMEETLMVPPASPARIVPEKAGTA
jgi:hypothetical protein